MKKQIAAIIFGIALISLASASSIYAGECLEIDLSELESLDNVVYDVVGNSSNLEGLIIDLDDAIANICTTINYKPDSFTLIFIDDSTKTIVKEVHVGGGGGGSSVIYRDNYIDREVEIEVERESEDLGEVKRKTIPLIVWIVIGCAIIGLLIWLGFKFKSKENPNE